MSDFTFVFLELTNCVSKINDLFLQFEDLFLCLEEYFSVLINTLMIFRISNLFRNVDLSSLNSLIKTKLFDQSSSHIRHHLRLDSLVLDFFLKFRDYFEQLFFIRI